MHLIKNNKQKTNKRKLCMRQWIFAHQIWLNHKKKSRNTTKCHNIFTISLYSAMVSFGLIYYYLFYRNAILITNSRWQVVTGFKMDPRLISLFYPSIVAYHIWFVVKLMWKCCGISNILFDL